MVAPGIMLRHGRVMSSQKYKHGCLSRSSIAAATEEAADLGLWPSLSDTELQVRLRQVVMLLDCTPTDAVDIARWEATGVDAAHHA